MYELQDYYPFFWALCAVLAVFIAVMLDIMRIDLDEKLDIRKTKLRDKLFFSMMQNRGCHD